ncbi:MAG: hypothetical protein AUH29_11170 [Candidatus Rokubacteria bacterium 13_1_40CM_69_27]|nr:MAG: hypothetical protein AUH29_11170 [Candidatus Rokubacteria bacterium 13_1_40CM_69_27]
MWWLLWPGLAFVMTLLAALALRSALLGAARKWARPAGALATFADGVGGPSLLWCLVLALYVAMEVALELSAMPPRLYGRLGLLLEAAVIVSVTLTLAGLLGTLIRRASERQALGPAVTGLGQAVARGVVLVVGFLVLLGALGIQITPILTALGVGGLAVALALQDTLSNLFAGMHLLADQPMRVGDFIKIADNVEGYVIDIGWRSTRLRTLQNNVVVVPNKKLAESIITNYNLPQPPGALTLKVSVGYHVDPDRVEAILIEETRAGAGQVPGLLDSPEPVVLLIPGFGDFSLDFTLVCHTATLADQARVQHEQRKRILRRFRAEGIVIPFPTRTVELRQTGTLPHQAEQQQRADHRER